MRDKIGFHDVKWTLDEMSGRSVNFKNIIEGTIMEKINLSNIKITYNF